MAAGNAFDDDSSSIVGGGLGEASRDPHVHNFQIQKRKDGTTKVTVPMQFVLDTSTTSGSTTAGLPRAPNGGGGSGYATPTTAAAEDPYIMRGGFKMGRPKSGPKPLSGSSFLPDVAQIHSC